MHDSSTIWKVAPTRPTKRDAIRAEVRTYLKQVEALAREAHESPNPAVLYGAIRIIVNSSAKLLREIDAHYDEEKTTFSWPRPA